MATRALRNVGWKIGALPILAIVAATALRIGFGADHVSPITASGAAGLPAPPAVAPAPGPPAGVPGTQYRVPAGVAVRGLKLYISDVPTNAIWIHDLSSGAEAVIAGSLGPGYSGDGGPAIGAQLTEPRGMVLDAVGNLYIADSGNHAIRKIGLDGTIATVAGNGTRGFSGDGGPATSAQLDTPSAVALDSAGNLYIADTLNHRIRKVDSAGSIVTVAGSGTLSLVAGTGGFGFSGDGGPAILAQLSIPEGVAVAPDGTLYIADTGNDRIRQVDVNGIIQTVAGTGKYRYSGDGGPAALADIYAPVGVAVGPGGGVYFSERDNQTVRMITTRGLMVAVAGRGRHRGDTGDGGPALGAELSDPEGIAFGPDGQLYIADAGNHRIRVVTPGGSIIKAV